MEKTWRWFGKKDKISHVRVHTLQVYVYLRLAQHGEKGLRHIPGAQPVHFFQIAVGLNARARSAKKAPPRLAQAIHTLVVALAFQLLAQLLFFNGHKLRADDAVFHHGRKGRAQGNVHAGLAQRLAMQQNFGTAAYYILCKAEAGGFIESGEDERAEDMYVFIHGGKNVKMDDNGVLHAYYSDNVVYMKDKETGERSDIPMVLIDNDSSSTEKRYLTSVVLTKTEDDFATTSANLQIVVDEEHPDGIIRNAVPISSDDEEIQRANKQLLDIDDYNIMSVVGRCSYLTRDDNGKLLQFFDWENSGILMGFEQNLKSGYELEVTPIENPENYVCMFIVTDSQGNSTVSELIPLG